MTLDLDDLAALYEALPDLGEWLSELDIDGTMRAADGSPVCVIPDDNLTEVRAAFIAAAKNAMPELLRLARAGERAGRMKGHAEIYRRSTRYRDGAASRQC